MFQVISVPTNYCDCFMFADFSITKLKLKMHYIIYYIILYIILYIYYIIYIWGRGPKGTNPARQVPDKNENEWQQQMMDENE